MTNYRMTTRRHYGIGSPLHSEFIPERWEIEPISELNSDEDDTHIAYSDFEEWTTFHVDREYADDERIEFITEHKFDYLTIKGEKCST